MKCRIELATRASISGAILLCVLATSCASPGSESRESNVARPATAEAPAPQAAPTTPQQTATVTDQPTAVAAPQVRTDPFSAAMISELEAQLKPIAVVHANAVETPK